MSVVADKINNSLHDVPRRRVSIRRDDNDFIVAIQPENLTVFRNGDASALRRVCRQLRWEIVADVGDRAS
jgi:YbbR domain-containing protein